MKLTPNGEAFLARIDRDIEEMRAKNGLRLRRVPPPTPPRAALSPEAIAAAHARRERWRAVAGLVQIRWWVIPVAGYAITGVVLVHALVEGAIKRHHTRKMVEQINELARTTTLRCQAQAGLPPASGDGYMIWRVHVDACVAEEMNRH